MIESAGTLPVDTCDSALFECRAILVPERSGFSIYAKRLPGVVSEGDTEQEAIANFREACIGAIETYRSRGMEIPWQELDSETEDGKELWILVDG